VTEVEKKSRKVVLRWMDRAIYIKNNPPWTLKSPKK
jgi:hypothetical protein